METGSIAWTELSWSFRVSFFQLTDAIPDTYCIHAMNDILFHLSHDGKLCLDWHTDLLLSAKLLICLDS